MNIFPYFSLNHFFQLVARLSFALTILLAPFRLRFDAWARPFFPVYSDYTDFLIFTSDFALFFTLVFWACSLILEPRKVEAGNRFVFIALTGLTVAAWASVLGSVDVIITRYNAFRFTCLWLLYLYIVNEISTAKWVVIPAALQALIQVPVAVGQSLLQSSLGLSLLGEHVLDPAVKGTSIIPVNGERILRAYGLADHPNILGGCLAFAMVMLLVVVLHGSHRKPLFAAIGFLMSFPALLLNYSRSAWLSLFVAVSFLVVFEAFQRKWEALGRAVLLGLVCLAVAVPLFLWDGSVFQKRFNDGDIAADGPMFERAFLLEAGNTLFVEHSILGIGLGASPLAMKLRFEYFPLNFQPPHYTPLLSALETGLVGGGFYLLLFVMPGIVFLFRWRDHIKSPQAMGVIALLLAISVVNLFDYYTWYYAPGRIWQWTAWGLYSVISSKSG